MPPQKRGEMHGSCLLNCPTRRACFIVRKDFLSLTHATPSPLPRGLVPPSGSLIWLFSYSYNELPTRKEGPGDWFPLGSRTSLQPM